MTDNNDVSSGEKSFDQVLHDLKKTIANTNINFLIGAGSSSPFLEILKDIEKDLTAAEDSDDEDKVVELKGNYFTKCMVGNLEIIDELSNNEKDKVLDNYKEFYKTLNFLLLKREDSILTKQVNIFTTNIDVFSEKALEETNIEFNDGFNGLFKPQYDLGNFKKSYFQKSLHYEKTSEIPVFNILKLHGSVCWKQAGEKIFLDRDLSVLKAVQESLDKSSFEDEYKQLVIVNPTKKKFEDTVLDRKFSDLLRIYSNELEKENSVLFVVGFSFSDEHIHDLTIQVANSNPTLTVYIFSHSSGENDTYKTMRDEAKNKNIKVLYPPEDKKYNLKTITTDFFEKITPKEIKKKPFEVVIAKDEE